LGKLTLRLPTEAEWEKAARGEYGNEWPWGNEFDKNRCNSSEGRQRNTTPVNSYSPQGDSPYGCADMAGNVWEWTHTLWQGYPYQAGDGRENEKASGARVLRGGSFGFLHRGVRCAFRDLNYYNPDNRDYDLGFRLCVSPISLKSGL
jgi:toxoflavin biosynthesis protein ToxD